MAVEIAGWKCVYVTTDSMEKTLNGLELEGWDVLHILRSGFSQDENLVCWERYQIVAKRRPPMVFCSEPSP